MDLDLNEIGKTEHLLYALDFWQTVATYLIEIRDEPVVIVHLPESEERETYQKCAQELTNKLYPKKEG